MLFNVEIGLLRDPAGSCADPYISGNKTPKFIGIG